jgi:FkbM family methyltransferase
VQNRGDAPWQDHEPAWTRGKLHNYEMLLDLRQWPSRAAFFTGRYYDMATQSLLCKLLKPGDTFVDIGANEGMIALTAAHLVGPSGTVIAFEPNPGPRSFLERAIARNDITNIRVEDYGVGFPAATLPLTVPRVNSGQGSFGRPDPNAGEVDVVECQVKPADPLLADYRPSLIKIDVEGFELKALIGIRETLERSRPPVVMEMVSRHLQRAGTSVSEVRDFMTALGYEGQALSWDKGPNGYQVSLHPADFQDAMDQDVLWTGRP